MRTRERAGVRGELCVVTMTRQRRQRLGIGKRQRLAAWSQTGFAGGSLSNRERINVL